MERLTKRDTDGQAMMDCQKCEADWTGKHGKPMVDCTALYCRNRLKDRLAAYEDTGLTPEQVDALKMASMGKAVAQITEFEGLPIARLRELAEADKDGRLVVPPCKAGDTVYEVTSRKTISEYRVKAIRVELFCTFIEWDIVAGFVDKSIFGVPVDEIGKTVFLAREEAEKALETMKK
uniref:Uncharacterized protein n=1 Tax=Podoviridae sp. ctyDR6 TaxID=2825288 RepID=A0A8S5QKY2_9CAUD|nr:MAG TPA: hypothetical protein [Podoviridae sp. ctyDR6]